MLLMVSGTVSETTFSFKTDALMVVEVYISITVTQKPLKYGRVMVMWAILLTMCIMAMNILCKNNISNKFR